MIIALVGNQNCGKTTIFNEMTNMNQHVGNFPGVTVEAMSGRLQGNKNCIIVDLPGLYSLNTYTTEENISKEFITKNKSDVLINVIDSTNLERNLYLTLQLKELGIPIIIALNMLDELEKQKGRINIKELSKRLQLPIVQIKNINKDEIKRLINETLRISNMKRNIKRSEFKNKDEIIEKYNEIEKICEGIIYLPNNKDEKSTYKIDKILTNKILGIPIFICIMIIIFYLTFNVIGEYCSDLINKGIIVITNRAQEIFVKNNTNIILRSLIIEGFFNGIGSVLSFLPIIVTLYFFLSILEDSGYMTRIAFIMDKPLSKLGLSGKSIVPILLGFGCSVPAILSTRTIKSERERKMIMLLVPFISCSAKIPIYAVFVSVFFKGYEVFAMLSIYIVGIITGILITILLKRSNKLKEQDLFMMELPNYRWPTMKNTFRLMWNKAKEFISKAFSIIFISTIIIWFFKSFDMNLNWVSEEYSILAKIAQKISPIFKPLGFGDWRIIISLITGISAKEAVVSTLSVLTNTSVRLLPEFVKTMFTTASSISFLIFILLYTPCIASLGIIKKEFNVKVAISVAINQLIIAYFMSFISYQLSNFFLYFF